MLTRLLGRAMIEGVFHIEGSYFWGVIPYNLNADPMR